MKLITMNCPNCNAALQVNPEREFMYCEYCGTKIGISKDEHVTRIIDEAAIRQSEAEEKMKIKEIEHDKWEQKMMLITGLVLMMFMVFLILFAAFYQ